MDKNEITQKELRTSRILFLCQDCCFNAINIVTTGAFLSGLAYLLGAQSSDIAMIGALPILMNVVQVLSSVVFENRTRAKGIIIGAAVIQRILMVSVLFLPFYFPTVSQRIFCIAFLTTAANFFGAFLGTGANNWLLNLIAKDSLGKYLGFREAITLTFATVMSLIFGRLLDLFKFHGQERLGFQVFGCIAIVFAIIDFICLAGIKEPVIEKSGERVTLVDIIKGPLLDRGYRKVLYFFLFWSIASNIASPFFNIYMVGELSLSYLYITFLSFIASISRVVFVIAWGKLADKKSWILVAKVSILILGATYVCWGLITKENYYWLLPVVQMVSGMAWGGIGISTFNIPYAMAPVNHRVSYVSMNIALSGIAGFMAAMLATKFSKRTLDLKIFKGDVSTIQIIFIISGFAIMGSALYIGKLKKLKMER